MSIYILLVLKGPVVRVFCQSTRPKKKRKKRKIVFRAAEVRPTLSGPLFSSDRDCFSDSKLTELRAASESPKRKRRLTVREAWNTTHPPEHLITTQMTNN